MKKKIIFMLLLLVPVAFAAVTRTVQDSWICPGENFNSFPAYTLKDPDPNDEIKKIAWFGISPTKDIIYTLNIPSASLVNTITGVYVLDSGNEKPISPTGFIVHEDECRAGTEEDLDGDGYGKGCACADSDCCDSGDDISSLGCTQERAFDINPGVTESNCETNDCNGENDGIDNDCDGCDFVDLDNDGYRKLGTGCGADDCDDSKNYVNPGQPEINCDDLDNNCLTEACLGTGTDGDCCPSTNPNNISYYDTDCDCEIDLCDDIIPRYLAGTDFPLDKIIEAIPICGYSNP